MDQFVALRDRGIQLGKCKCSFNKIGEGRHFAVENTCNEHCGVGLLGFVDLFQSFRSSGFLIFLLVFLVKNKTQVEQT